MAVIDALWRLGEAGQWRPYAAHLAGILMPLILDVEGRLSADASALGSQWTSALQQQQCNGSQTEEDTVGVCNGNGSSGGGAVSTPKTPAVQAPVQNSCWVDLLAGIVP